MKNGRHLTLNARGIAATAAVAGSLLIPASLTSVSAGAHVSAAHATQPNRAARRAAARTASKTSAQSPVSHLTNSENPPVGPQAGQSSAASIGGTVVGAAPTPDGNGFWEAWSNGGVSTAGDAVWQGDVSNVKLNGSIVGIASNPNGQGYWLLGSDGGVFNFGSPFFGSTGGMRLNAPALQVQATPSGHGYDFVAGDGGVFTFGTAGFFGSTGNVRLNQPVVGMATNPSGNGYWLVARDGGVFPFGNAGYFGSTGNVKLAQPVVGIARTGDGGGYWLVARDGGVFNFGDAPFFGSAVGRTGGSPVVSIVPTGDGGGYWVVTASGLVVPFGDAPAISGPVAASTPADSNFAFEVTNSGGSPARWNPCEAVHYAVVTSNAPAGWQNDVANDIGQVAQATGLNFVSDGAFGSTASVPSSSKVVISWVGALSGGDTVGLTTYQYYNSDPYAPEIISAQVQILDTLRGGGGTSGEQPVLLHELGHAVGLAHVNAAEVMNPVDQGFGTYQAGDLNGLQRLGSAQGCDGFYG